MVEPLADFLFEISFEVCNKVGGIYTVVSSKAYEMSKRYKNYCLIGPYFENQANKEFTRLNPPKEFKEVIDELASQNIIIHFGKWNIKGEPFVFLIDYSKYFDHENDLRKLYWDKFQIDSYGKGYDFSEPMIFSTIGGMIVEKVKSKFLDSKFALHCHEWMTGFAGLYLKQAGIDVGTTFTTHATMLGRTMSSYDFNLYQNLKNIDGVKEAYKANVQEKHLTEVACANNLDVFTTVSPITALECEGLLGKMPDMILLNGLQVKQFPTFEEASIKHRLVREKIKTFLSYFFGPYQKVDFDNSLFFYTSGRFEYKNKGVDLLISSLGDLNRELKKDPNSKTIYVFIMVPNGVDGINPNLLHNRNKFFDLKSHISKNAFEIEENILKHAINGDDVNDSNILSSESKENLNNLKNEFNRTYEDPLFTTHNLAEGANDDVVEFSKQNGLHNADNDKVKIVYAPFYIEKNDGVFDMHYYELISGFHLGIFPSYYEPFGYTPFESVALSVPCVTTNLSGFGRLIAEGSTQKTGVFIVDRLNSNYHDSARQLTDFMKNYAYMDVRSRVDEKINANNTSKQFDWENLADEYVKAHNLSIEKINH